MREAVSDILASRAHEPDGLHRLLGYSLAVHLAIGVIAVVMPDNWLSSQATRPRVMEVSLGGSIGQKTTGTAPISGRRVDQAVPEPTRPEPVKPAPPPPKPDTMPTPTKAVPPPKPPPPKPVEKPPAQVTPRTPTRPPSTGRQVQAGTARTETGATGVGPGITSGGGGGTGGAIDLNSFDPIWVKQMTDAIERRWISDQPDSGWTEILFVLEKDGSLKSGGLEVTASTQNVLLNAAAERAIRTATIAPLPADYREATLSVRLRFNYGKQ